MKGLVKVSLFISRVVSLLQAQFEKVYQEGEVLLKDVDRMGLDLSSCDPSVEGKVSRVTQHMVEAFSAVCEKVWSPKRACTCNH